MSKDAKSIYLKITSYRPLNQIGDIPREWVEECIEEGLKLKIQEIRKEIEGLKPKSIYDKTLEYRIAVDKALEIIDKYSKI